LTFIHFTVWSLDICKVPHLRYVELEAALAQIMSIKPRQLGAFRARLRHFRNIGAPNLPKTGSGRAIDYTRQHAFEILLALELQKIGQIPRRAALVAGSITRVMPYGQYDGKDCYVLCYPDRRDYTGATGLEQLMTVIKSAPTAFAVINASACARKLEEAFGSVNARR
jgi:hypothetical protein